MRLDRTVCFALATALLSAAGAAQARVVPPDVAAQLESRTNARSPRDAGRFGTGSPRDAGRFGARSPRDAGRFGARSPRDAGQFEQLVQEVVVACQSTAAAYGATLTKRTEWSSPTANATTMVQGNVWSIIAFGGLYRVEGMTNDAFQIAICHEVGHLMGGFPYYERQAPTLATSEGQADYYAAHYCARVLWRDQIAANRAAYERATPAIQQACDAQWDASSDVDLCARIAGSAEHLLQILTPNTTLATTTPDPTVAATTLFSHYPNPQCRLDTYVRGALCRAGWNAERIPGYALAEHNGLEAEREALRQSCHRQFESSGARPMCWYHQRIDD